MPDWLLIFVGFTVLVVLIIALVCLSVIVEQWCASHRIKEQPRADDDWNNRQENIQSTDIRIVASYLKTIGDEAYSYRQQQNRHDERRATLEKVGVIAAAVAAGLAAISAVIFYWQFDDARRATIAANRAWVGIYRADHGVLVATKPMYIQMTVVNTGREPALQGNWGFKIHAINHVPENNGNFSADLASFRNDSCNGVHLFPNGEGTSIWPTLFHTPDPGNPNDPHLGPAEIPYVSESGAQADIDAAIARSKSLILDACFIYWSGDQWRRTSARFLLRDQEGVSASRWGFNQIASGNSAN